MVLAPSLLHKSSMTKKRVKFGLAILGVLAVFLLALLALVFAPTGASAGKGPVLGQEQGGDEHHPNLAYLEPPAGNGPNNDPGHSDSGFGPCFGPLCDTHDDGDDDSWHYTDAPGGQGGGINQGNSPNPNSGDHPQGGNGYPPSLFVGGYPGGYPGGGYGAPQGGQSSSCASKKDKDEDAKDKESEDKSCDDDNKGNNDNNSSDNSNNSGSNSHNNSGNNNGGDESGYEQLIINGSNPPNNFGNDDQDDDDDDLPPVDPNCFPFTEGCDTHEGNPPITDLTDPPSEVPEPLTLSLFAVGLTGAAAMRRRVRQKSQPD